MDTFRILIVDMPHLLRDIVRTAVSFDSKITVVGEVPADAEVAERIAETDAGFVVCGDELDDWLGPMPLLDRFPRLRVLEVASDSATGVLYELSPSRKRIGPLSAQLLVETIRGSA